MLSRFIVVVLLESRRTHAIVDALLGSWFHISGRPKKILTDRFPMYDGDEWGC